ncbi:hypothetical protein DV733_00510 [Halapricum salinum]|uniref:Uncharacterized protein n=1 Tax=Halapricum salinum TaxID=1457250 RepID=A0A4D6HHQ4_9EURY|nr:hypothetical protein DV733_00510 [Halapricum salinum]
MLQSGLAGGGVVPLIVTFVVAWVFYAVTLHLAATFFIGEVPSQKAATVAPAPALVSILLGQYGRESVAFISEELGVLIVLLATLLADALAISRVYDLAPKPTAVLTLLHFAFATAMGIALANLFGLL